MAGHRRSPNPEPSQPEPVLAEPALLAALIARVGRIHDHLLQQVAAGYGLTNTDTTLLSTLLFADDGSGLTPTALTDAMVWTSAATAVALRRLETAGLVVRTHDADDGRRRRVRLSDKGRAIAHQHLADVERLEHEITEALSARQTRDMIESLTHLLDQLERRSGQRSSVARLESMRRPRRAASR